MRPKILFDLSEVLIAGFYGFESVVAQAEGRTREEVRPFVAGQELWDLCAGRITEDQFLDNIRNRGGCRRMDKAAMAKAIRDLFRETVPGMPEYLGQLAETCDLYLLSDHAREWIPDVVAFHPFLKHFKRRYYSYEFGSIKREGTPFRHVVQDLGIQASDLFFIDDSAANVAAARACGLTAHVFTSREKLEPELSAWISRQQRLQGGKA